MTSDVSDESVRFDVNPLVKSLIISAGSNDDAKVASKPNGQEQI
jgi:hypothetical protein